MTTRVRLLLTPALDLNQMAIQKRLEKFLVNLRARKLARDLIGDDDRSEEFGVKDFVSFSAELSEGNELTYRASAGSKPVQRLWSRRAGGPWGSGI